ncbi:MAG: 5-methylcytosine-specific restriction endonuclease system specificity protein McrC [Thermoguttaceae bacterium]
MTALDTNRSAGTAVGHIAGIPVRNLWLLMLYASDLFRQHQRGKIAVEQNPDDIPDLVAEILAKMVERRLRRNLVFGYRREEAVLSRIRGHIDLLWTKRHRLLDRGLIACRFDNLTVDTPRNRFVMAALEAIARIVRRQELKQRCRALAASLKHLGVSGNRPSRAEMSTDRYSHHDAEDQVMVGAAQLAFDLMLPTEASGCTSLVTPERETVWVRRLYERAVGGFYDVVLSGQGWRVDRGKTINWQVDHKTAGIDRILPAMRTDIVLDHDGSGRRIVIDTKFTSVLVEGWYREETLRSGFIYQIYAYLRSQEGSGDVMADRAAGLLLHPSVGLSVDETVVIQGHPIRFATVDLGASASMIREQLRNYPEKPWP